MPVQHVPRIPVIFVAGRDDLGMPEDVCRQISLATPTTVTCTKTVGELVEFCGSAIIPDLVIFTNLNNDGVETIPIILQLRKMGIRVAVLVSKLTEPAIREIQGLFVIRKPARWQTVIQTVACALPAPASS